MARKSSSRNGRGQRTLVVWCALAMGIVGVGGVLAVLDRSPQTNFASGLPVLMASTDTPDLQSIFALTQKLDRNRWQAIVIHHTASPFATTQSLETQAKAAGLTGLGHHFVIGNGNGINDGHLNVGARWMNQQPGAHAQGKNAIWLNQHAISICLVGDGNSKGFSESQMRRLVQLTKALAKELNISASERIYLQSDIEPRIKSPGEFFSNAEFRKQLEATR